MFVSCELPTLQSAVAHYSWKFYKVYLTNIPLFLLIWWLCLRKNNNILNMTGCKLPCHYKVLSTSPAKYRLLLRNSPSWEIFKEATLCGPAPSKIGCLTFISDFKIWSSDTSGSCSTLCRPTLEWRQRPMSTLSCLSSRSLEEVETK